MTYPFIDPETGLPVVVKQESEVKTLYFDFASHLRDYQISEILYTHVESLNRVPGSVALVHGYPALDTYQTVAIPVLDGSDGEAYRVTVRVSDTNVGIFELDCVVYVVEG